MCISIAIYLLDFQIKYIFADNYHSLAHMGRLKKLKKIRIHREGTHILWGSLLLLLLINVALYYGIECKLPFYLVVLTSIIVYGLMVNFFRCPKRLFGEETEKIVVAPADTRQGLVRELRLMQCYLMPDETALRELSEQVIEKLKRLTDAEFAGLEFPMN